jgi:heat shock protein HslJ
MKHFTLLLAASLVFSACDLLPDPGSTPDQTLEDTRWNLTAYGERDGTLSDVDVNPDVRDGPYTVRFLQEGNFSVEDSSGLDGDTGCNSFDATYQVDEETNELSVFNLTITLMSCDNEEEGVLTDGLLGAASYRRDGQSLRIFYPEDESRVLVFSRREEAE